jgi:hypothetical protein
VSNDLISREYVLEELKTRANNNSHTDIDSVIRLVERVPGQNRTDSEKPKREMRAVQIGVTHTYVNYPEWVCGKCYGTLKRDFKCCPYCQTVVDWSEA